MKLFSKIAKKIWVGVKKYQAEIMLVIIITLISLLSFAIGYLVAKERLKEPMRIEKSTNNEFITNLRIKKKIYL